MLTITRKDLLLTINDNVIPASGSSDVPVKFVNDAETYAGFLIEPRVGYYINGCLKSTVCEYDTSINTIKIPAEAFKQRGVLVIAIALIDNEDSNHIEVTKELALEVTPAPNGTVVLPATDTWQTAVKNLVEQIYIQDYKPQFDQIEEDLSGLVEEAENQQNKANNQQTQIDNAIDIMGDYEIVQDNPTQIRFKKGNGTYGDTVNLGDNLASKSMVNAGYDTYSGNSYSGSASDYGIEIGKASGNYKQEGTPTPESPIEPKFFEPKHVNTNGGNLFDASKLPAKTQGGATVTNNGDGSFTVSGGGTLTETFNTMYVDLKKDEVKKLLKKGTLYGKVETQTNPYVGFLIFANGKWNELNMNFIPNPKSIMITEEMINADDLYGRIRFYGAINNTIKTGTIKPMLYQDGDGTWYPFNANSTPLSLTLRALPNGVCDTYENGVITRRVGYIEFDGSSDEYWGTDTIPNTQVKRFYTQLPNGLKSTTQGRKYCLSNKFLCNENTINTNDVYTCFHNSSPSISAFYCIVDQEIDNVEDFKTWLQSNPIKAWYQLEEPTTEQVDLPVIPSYYPYTNAWHDSEVEASELTWNILARQYGSGQTTIKKDEAVLTELDLNTERTVSPTTVKVQLKDTSGNTFYVETSADNVYLKGTDGTEISQQNLNDKIGQLINLVAFYSASPVSVLTDLKKYITSIT